MRVTRLEIFGFKSFVDRFVLNFDKSMIGIVGPNGCGKSNVVDALRWVLGETHARQLRGNLFDDLIFNGSQSRRPLGMAEVSITIRPHEAWSPNTFARVNTPGLEQGMVVELRNEDDPLLAQLTEPQITGAGDAEESRNGVVEEGEKSVPSSLLDIPGLFDSSEIQLTRRLYRSGESEYFINRVPCRLRDMIEFYRLIGLGARGLSIVQQGQISEIVTKKPLERRELIEEAAGIAGFRNRIEAAERKLEKTRDNIARLKDIILEVEKQVRSLSRQAKRARERVDLKEQLKTLELKLFNLRISLIEERTHSRGALIQHAQLEIENHEREFAIVDAKSTEARSAVEVLEQELADLRLKKDEIVGEISRRHAAETDLQLAVVKAEGRVKLVESNLRKLDQRKEAIGIELEKRRQDFERFQAQLEDLTTKRGDRERELNEILQRAREFGAGADDLELQQISNEITQLEVDVERIPALVQDVQNTERRIKSLRENLRTETSAHHERKVRVASLESEIRSIENQLQALADHVKKGAGLADDHDQSLGQVLLACIRAPQELQRPLAAVLGERAKFLVTADSDRILESFLQRRNQNDSARAQFGVIHQNTARGKGTGASIQSAINDNEFRLIDRLEFESQWRDAIECLLGEVYLVESVARGVELVRAGVDGGVAAIAVTTSGEVVTEWGWYTTEGKGASFSFARTIELRREELSRAEGEVVAALERVQAVEGELTQSGEELRQKQEERDRVQGLQRKLAELNRRRGEIERRRRDAVLSEERSAQTELRRLSEELGGLTRSVAVEKRRIEDLREERVTLDRETEDFSRQATEIAEQQIELQGQLAKLKELEADGGEGQSVANLEGTLRELDLKVREREGKRNSVKVQLANAEQNLDRLRREISRLGAETSDAKVLLERCAVEREMFLEDIRRYYGPEIDLPHAESIGELRALGLVGLEDEIGVVQPQALALRNRLEREGEVDPEAIEQYESESKRLTDMQAQYRDLEEAADTLARTIRHLTEISRQRFIETFELVSTKFSELIPRLFGGGAGQLNLVNPEDPLGSGIEIVVRPPGKKVRNLELLSGGEKALTATALLVAMFLHRPSPICVLDEVDAPLDDANLERFLGLVQEISRTTQFLIITHNKQTMAAADRLIGITMQESGVSTALSVSVDQAVEELEGALAANA